MIEKVSHDRGGCLLSYTRIRSMDEADNFIQLHNCHPEEFNIFHSLEAICKWRAPLGQSAHGISAALQMS